MAEIPLYWRNSQKVIAVALVDDADINLVAPYRWHRYKCAKDRSEYVATRVCLSRGCYRRLLMHRLIMDVNDPIVFVDHRNHDGLDNRRHNLRVCDVALNSQNRIDDKGKSRFRGVYQHRGGNWRGRLFLKRNGARSSISAGTFDNEISAALAIDKLRSETFPFAERDPALIQYLQEAR